MTTNIDGNGKTTAVRLFTMPVDLHMLAGSQCLVMASLRYVGVLTTIARVMSGITKKRVTMICLMYHTIPQRVWMDQVEEIRERW
jgi:hypothetical protein